MSERTETSATISICGKDFVSLSADILKKKKSFSFKAFGSSMWPFIKQGDILLVEAVDSATIKIGDVVFVRMSESKIIVHRIISINHAKKSAAMRGDSATSGAEILSFSQILGKVTRIRRNNKPINLDQLWRQSLIFLWYHSYPIRTLLLSFRGFVRRTIGWFTIKLTSFTTYRKIIRHKLSNKVHFRLAMNSNGETFNSQNSPVNGQLQPPADSAITHYSWLALYKNSTIGKATLVKFPDSTSMFPDWWIFGMNIRIPFRGAGIGHRLSQLALKKAQSEKGAFIYLIVERNNIAARSLYSKSGFTPTSLPQLSGILEDEKKRGLPQRIILKKQL